MPEKRSNAQIHPSLREPPRLIFNVVREFVSRMKNDFSCVEGGDWDSVAVFGWLRTLSLRQHVHERVAVTLYGGPS